MVNRGADGASDIDVVVMWKRRVKLEVIYNAKSRNE
jgi:hypothetical protein